ncbi:uncharacterized protein [Chelonus insularis]|uniref:uncharacterized protein n=1 Tax=Chelonus insularis TaxID=460826 RepID=UPI0015884D2F|nr:uncharacterized protein LOC118071248 [Chelonus insularis]
MKREEKDVRNVIENLLHNNIQRITKPAINRFAIRGDVKRISGLLYEETCAILEAFLENVICDGITYIKHAKNCHGRCSLRIRRSWTYDLRKKLVKILTTSHGLQLPTKYILLSVYIKDEVCPKSISSVVLMISQTKKKPDIRTHARPPEVILTDQGRNFMSALLQIVAKRSGIKKLRTTAYYPQSNGSSERSHQSLYEYLKFYSSIDDKWDDWIELAVFSYNTSYHFGIQSAPYTIVFGQQARLPSSEPIRECEQLPTMQGYLIDLVTR